MFSYIILREIVHSERGFHNLNKLFNSSCRISITAFKILQTLIQLLSIYYLKSWQSDCKII